MAAMSEAMAHRLARACRISFLVTLLAVGWVYWQMRAALRPDELPLLPAGMVQLLHLLVVWLGATVLLGLYLDLFLGLDVFGLNGLLGMPTGRPFGGLAPGEEERLRFDYSRGFIGWSNYNGLFKLCLTNRRLLAGVNLSSWYLLDLPLEEILTAEVRTRRLFPSSLRLTRMGLAGVERWELGLQAKSQFEQLLAELRRLGVPLQESHR